MYIAQPFKQLGLAQQAQLATLYEAFVAEAQPLYQWELPPVDWPQVAPAIARGQLAGYLVADRATEAPLGFWLYQVQPHGVLEIQLAYLLPDAQGQPRHGVKALLEAVLRPLLADAHTQPGWMVMSHALMGVQAAFARTAKWYGFSIYGQMMMSLAFDDPIGVTVFKQQAVVALPLGYHLSAWQPAAAGGVATLLHQAFCGMPDAQWDPRFRTEAGVRQMLATLQAGMLGPLDTNATSLLWAGDALVGVCLLLASNPTLANIPLIAVAPQHQRRGLGAALLQRSIATAMDDFLHSRTNLMRVTATTDTERFGAIHLYRRFGFQEVHHYPQLCLQRRTQEAPMAASSPR
jgi:GNAT superfamily N-acetyltransferase